MMAECWSSSKCSVVIALFLSLPVSIIAPDTPPSSPTGGNRRSSSFYGNVLDEYYQAPSRSSSGSSGHSQANSIANNAALHQQYLAQHSSPHSSTHGHGQQSPQSAAPGHPGPFPGSRFSSYGTLPPSGQSSAHGHGPGSPQSPTHGHPAPNLGSRFSAYSSGPSGPSSSPSGHGQYSHPSHAPGQPAPNPNPSTGSGGNGGSSSYYSSGGYPPMITEEQHRVNMQQQAYSKLEGKEDPNVVYNVAQDYPGGIEGMQHIAKSALAARPIAPYGRCDNPAHQGAHSQDRHCQNFRRTNN